MCFNKIRNAQQKKYLVLDHVACPRTLTQRHEQQTCRYAANNTCTQVNMQARARRAMAR